MCGGGCGPAGHRLRPPLLVAERGLAARAPLDVVGYRTPTAAFAGEVHTLLDPATNGSRWVSLTRGARSGRVAARAGTGLPSAFPPGPIRRPDRLSVIGQEN